MIQYQILQSDILRIEGLRVSRISAEILGVKGLNCVSVNVLMLQLMNFVKVISSNFYVAHVGLFGPGNPQRTTKLLTWKML